MPLKKLLPAPGVNKENTRYTNEGRWFSCDKVRFRQGTPEKIGGWQQVSNDQFLGICRSLWAWTSLGGAAYIGLGTNLKYYIALANGGLYNDVTPIRKTVNPMLGPNPPGSGDPFLGDGTTTVTVTDVAHGCVTGDFVTFSGATGTYASTFNAEFQVTVLTADTYTITTPTAIIPGSYGGAAVVAAYQINVGDEIETALSGWGAGGWGLGGWGVGATSTTSIRIWNHYNFGEDLIYGPKDGPMYYWDQTAGLTTRGVALTSLPGASDVPTVQRLLMVSDASRIVLAFGCNDYNTSVQDPMLIRWSDQESAVNWTPAATSQAGSLRLSHGSAIQAVAQVRQEILVWSDTAVYSLQYLGPPIVWGSQILSDNVSIVSDRAWATAAGVTYWMGNEKFYMYDGRVQALNCDLRQYIFNDFNFSQNQQVFAGTNEQFTEIWWFYCSANSTVVDRYAIYNYTEKVWYYGNLARTAWMDSTVSNVVPLAADYNRRLLNHETGVDDNATSVTLPIESYITSAEFDIDDGHNFGFVWRIIPDLTFDGSSNPSPAKPQAVFTVRPRQNPGAPYGTAETPTVTSAQSYNSVRNYNVQEFTEIVYTRIRGRQMAFKISSDTVGTQWQLGVPRIDVRPDGRR